MIAVRSFAKINLGLKIGPLRADGFHELRTVYQTLALHDVVRVDVRPGVGIEIRCDDPRVPLDQSNTCYKVAERVLAVAGQGLKPRPAKHLNGTAEAVPLQNSEVPQGLKPGFKAPPEGTAQAVPYQEEAFGTARTAPLQEEAFVTAEAVPPQSRNQASVRSVKVIIEIDKRLPVQGGLGAASSNGVATMIGLECALRTKIADEEKLRIAAEVGSDLPLFLIGGTVLGVGRGEQVYPLQDLPPMHLVVVTPSVGVSTPAAFARWDAMVAREAELTGTGATGTINKLSQDVFARLSESVFSQAVSASEPASGVPAVGGDRAETPLLDLVRAGIENDFERVVFSEYPELLEVKRVLEREGARVASLSGSGSTLYGVFASGEEAQDVAARMGAAGHAAMATTTLTRNEYWRQMLVEGSLQV